MGVILENILEGMSLSRKPTFNPGVGFVHLESKADSEPHLALNRGFPGRMQDSDRHTGHEIDTEQVSGGRRFFED